MPAINRCALPTEALLQRYAGSSAYADCYATDVAQDVSHAAFVEAFYTTRVFKLERLILRLFASRPSTDLQARQLADGTASSFAAWTVEDRATDQLLLADFSGRTRSWLMIEPLAGAASPGTRLYFGSAVIPVRNQTSGRTSLGFAFRALLGFHKLYSRILLATASAQLARQERMRQKIWRRGAGP